MDERREFADWFRMQRESRRLTDDQAAEYLDLRLPTILRIEGGGLTWAQLPPDIKEKIESKFGEYRESDLEEQEQSVPFRQAESTAFLVDIREEIQQTLEESDPPEDKPETTDSEQSSPDRELEAIEYICRCKNPVQIRHEGRCPECERVGGIT